MGFSRRTLGIASVVVILLGALGGIYIRLRALQAEEENGAVEAAEGEAQEVESAQAFRSDIAIPVGAAPVVRDTLVMSVSAAGQAQAFARTLLAAEVEGPVTQVLVREGDRVRRGQVLARIDPERFAFELERAHAQLEQAEANFAELTLFDDEIADEELRAERRRLARELDELALKLDRVHCGGPVTPLPECGRAPGTPPARALPRARAGRGPVLPAPARVSPGPAAGRARLRAGR